MALCTYEWFLGLGHCYILTLGTATPLATTSRPSGAGIGQPTSTVRCRSVLATTTVCRRDSQHEGTRVARSGGVLTMNTGVSIRFKSLQQRSFISPHTDLLSHIARYVAEQSHGK